MNFDELQKQWNNQSSDDVQINKESLHKTKSIISQVNKNIKNELILAILCLIFLIILPYLKFHDINGISALFYYFFIFQIFLCSLTYYRKFYFFNQSTKKNDSFKSKENIIKMYYELKFAVESYRSACYFLIPQVLGLYFILFTGKKAEIYLKQAIELKTTTTDEPFIVLKILVIGIIFLIFVIALSEWIINQYYGKYLKQLKSVLDDFNV